MIKKPLAIIILLLSFNSYINAQSGIGVSGGDFVKNNISYEYVFNQVLVTSNVSSSIKAKVKLINYDLIIDESGILSHQNEIQLTASVFPNPTVSDIQIEIPDFSDNLTYKIHTLRGRVVYKGTITEQSTLISFIQFSSATYLLNIYKTGSLVKSIKIIKR